MTDFTFGSLFSGIGGLDLGLERAGMKCVWQSEIEPYACRVLAKHWPNTPNLGDIRDIDWTAIPRVDLVAGGYPCQPFSLAGKRQGDNDPRHLWPMFAECLRVLRPRFALLENVTGHLSLGFGDVQADLAALGYDSRWDCIPAAAVGAPHCRDRIFVIATRTTSMDSNSESKSRFTINELSRTWKTPMANANSSHDERERFTIRREPKLSNSHMGSNKSTEDLVDTNTNRGRTQHGTVNDGERRHHSNGSSRKQMVSRSGKRSSNDEWRSGSAYWKTEPNVGRMADGIPNRMDRLRGLGNAVVPQVAEHMGRIIMDMQ